MGCGNFLKSLNTWYSYHHAVKQ